MIRGVPYRLPVYADHAVDCKLSISVQGQVGQVRNPADEALAA